MSVTAAFREGLRRVNGAPALLAGTFALTLMVSLPLAYALHGMIAEHLGASLAADAAASGTNPAWWREFLAQATGLGTTFIPSIVGFGAVLNNLSDFMDRTRPAATIIGVTAAWLVVWSFLTGGIIDRLARARRTRSQGFFSACGLHFWRLLRLGIIALIAYGILRTQLFDIDLRIRWTIKQSTLAAAVVAIVYVLSEGASRLLSNELGNVAGLLGAAVVVFFLAPLQRFAERVAAAAMPNTHDTAEYATFRKLQVYEAAVTDALPGGVGEKERALLRRLRDSLGISAADAASIERDLDERTGQGRTSLASDPAL